VAEGSPTVRRRELGALLRKLREEKGLSVKDVTDHLLCSPSKVSRIETGQRGATLRDVRDLCDLYGVKTKVEQDRLMTLAKEGKQQGWWQSYDLPFALPMYVGLEAEAVYIKDYDSALIPGLLQSPDYSRALHQEPVPEPTDRQSTTELVEQRVDVRSRRQELLNGTNTRAPLQLWTVLDEAALHRAIGGPKVMREQLELVVKKMALPNVTVQIIPFSAGAHPALDSTFNILEFSGGMPAIVYSEGLAGFIFMDRDADIDRYQRVFTSLVEKAVTPEESADLILKVSRQFGNDALKAAG
jgi:transcriptional regulator with XRE-family HTH domain